LPQLQPDPYISVLVAEYDIKPEVIKGIVAKSASGGFLLRPRNISSVEGNGKISLSQRFGSIPEHVEINEKSEYSWKVYMDRPGKVYVDVSYSYQGKNSGGKIDLTINDTNLIHEALPTGMFVGEPNQNWQIESYNASRLGEIEINKKGYYDINLKIDPEKGEIVKFQWVWLGVE